MAGTFTTVDLSKLPAPTVVETLSYEAIFAAMLADLIARDPAFTALVESDPAYKVLEVCAYRELLVRQHNNESALSVMLAFATGADLDQIGANFNVKRLLITAGNPNALPPTEDVFESDADFRSRIQLAWEGLSVAGPVGAYISHARAADADVLDASVESPTPGAVVVSVLARSGTGAASAALLTKVSDALNSDDVRPLTDSVTVQSATITTYTIEAALTLFPGPDSAVVLAEAEARVDAYTAASRRLGRDITRFGILGALAVEGVQNVSLTQPAADIVVSPSQAAACTSRTITVAGTNE